MTSGNVTEEFVHKDLGYISQNLLTKDAGNQAVRLDVRDCTQNLSNYIVLFTRALNEEEFLCRSGKKWQNPVIQI